MFNDSDLSTFKNARALERWNTALAYRNTAPARILCLGDSITEGQGASSPSNRWTNMLLSNLRQRFQTVVAGITVPGGVGYLPAYFNSASMGTPYTSTTGTTPTQVTQYGLGRRMYQVSAAWSVTYTFTGTSLWVWYVSSGAASSFSVKVDSGTAQTVNADTGGYTDGQTYKVTGLTAGSHTVTITWVSGTVYFEGVSFYNGDETSGIQVYESGHYGTTSSDWAYSLPGYDTYAWPLTINVLQPALVILALGTNDFLPSNNQGAQTPIATYTTNMQAIITAIRQACTIPPSILLLAFPQRGDVTPGTTSGATLTWGQYTNAMLQLSRTDPQIAFLDLSVRYTSPAVSNALGNWSSDLVHPTPSGHALVGASITEFVTPR